MNTVTVTSTMRVSVEFFYCRQCEAILPVGLHDFGYCLKCAPRTEYFYCLVCGERLPERRRYHGTHEECQECIRPVTRLYTRARMSIVKQRRKRVAEIMDGMTPRQIADTLGVPVGTVNNDLRFIRGTK